METRHNRMQKTFQGSQRKIGRRQNPRCRQSTCTFTLVFLFRTIFNLLKNSIISVRHSILPRQDSTTLSWILSTAESLALTQCYSCLQMDMFLRILFQFWNTIFVHGNKSTFSRRSYCNWVPLILKKWDPLSHQFTHCSLVLRLPSAM